MTAMNRARRLLLAAGLAATMGVAAPALAAVIGCTAGVTCSGTSGPDELQGSGKQDAMYGRGGNDTLLGRGGNDLLRGDSVARACYGLGRLEGWKAKFSPAKPIRLT
jgi:Ca2+-binding RTX toxin-like protein